MRQQWIYRTQSSKVQNKSSINDDWTNLLKQFTENQGSDLEYQHHHRLRFAKIEGDDSGKCVGGRGERRPRASNHYHRKPALQSPAIFGTKERDASNLWRERDRESEGGKCVGGVERAVVRRRPLPLNTCTAVVGQSIVLREGASLRG